MITVGLIIWNEGIENKEYTKSHERNRSVIAKQRNRKHTKEIKRDVWIAGVHNIGIKNIAMIN